MKYSDEEIELIRKVLYKLAEVYHLNQTKKINR